MNKQTILEWIKIEKQLEILKNRKKILSDNIINDAKSNDLLNYKILLPSYNIKCISINEKESISKKYLLEKLTQYLKSGKEAQNAVNFIYKERDIKEKIIIKKYKKK